MAGAQGQGECSARDTQSDLVLKERQMWKDMCYHLPQATVLLDANKRIMVVTKLAAELLQISSEKLEGESADEAFGLTASPYQWVPSLDKSIDTRVGGARVVFAISNAFDDSGKINVTYLTIVHCSRSNKEIYNTRSTSESSSVIEDDNWLSMHSQLLDLVPAMIVAVSRDGKHIYQNALAHSTLGPITAPEVRDISSWMAQQYANAKHADGSPFDHKEMPLYQAAMMNRVSNQIEVYFGGFIYLLSGRPLYDKHGNHCGGLAFSHDVTDIRQAAERKELLALQQSDVRFREIANTMEQVVWVVRDQGVDFFNDRWYELTGSSKEQSLGMGWYAYLHPDDVEHTKNNWLLSQHDSDRFVVQHRIRSFDGTYRWYLARAIAIRDAQGLTTHWMGTSTDITQITEALQGAKLAREQLFNIMQIAHVHYFVVKTDFIMSSVFLAGGTDGPGLYGRYRINYLMNRDVRDLLSPRVLEQLQAVFDGKAISATDETEIDGVWWKTQFKAMKDEVTSSIVGVVGTAMDITEEKLKDEQLAKASTDRLVALQNSQFKGEFLARMSHEIRTPIGGILGMVQLMKDAFHPDDDLQVFCSHEKETESREYLESIKRCGDALLVIINDILDFSKIEIGKMDIENQPFDLHLMANDVYTAAKHGSHRHENVDFKLDYQVPKSMIFKGDSNRIRQILMNLMSNALKFTEVGTVVCRVSLCDEDENVSLPDSLPKELYRVKLQVIDTGIGISKSALEKLFNPFVQADSSTARRFGGTGLGLSIARQLVKLMSGALNLESVPAPDAGHGSVATCIIPLELSSKEGLNKMLPAPLIKFSGSPRVLLVEDNKINQVIARKTLEKLGLVTQIAENGQEAIDLLQAAGPNGLPSIILMDCQMPVLDGYEATSQIRKQVNSRIRTLPIVAMTASAISGDREKCLAAGMNDYISKPINPLLLSQTISKYLNPVPGVQNSANLLTEAGDNVRPSKEAILGQEHPMTEAAKDPHSSSESQVNLTTSPTASTLQKRRFSRTPKGAADLMDLDG